MRDKEKDAAMMAEKRKNMLEVSYRLFSEKGIEAVSMADIAKETGYGNTTLHRYYSNKTDLVVAVATWKWEQYTWEHFGMKEVSAWDNCTAADQFEYFLNAFIDLYKNHRDILRFNQFFNIFVRSIPDRGESLISYQNMISTLYSRFGRMYKKAQKDGTVRTYLSQTKMFTATLHLMLAAVTRFAVGLVYTPQEGTAPEEELVLLRDMMLDRFVVKDFDTNGVKAVSE